VAVANAVAMTADVRPRQEEAPDPLKELQASFREARSVIDELERLQDGIMDTLEDNTRGEGPTMDELPLAETTEE
jgi:holo-[acyl-carrier protein] synthase